jgi:ribosomal-protein-alanine N-acetyltransferase
MCPVPTLSHPPVTLRAPRVEDVADRLRCGRHPEATRMYGGDPAACAPWTAEDAEGWFRQTAGDPLAWVIDVGGRAIGTVRLHSHSEADRHARLSIGIFDAGCWGRGYGTAAIRLVLRHAFESMGLHRVDLRVLEYNERAIAAYTKCGFRREGVERESALVAGEWHSDVMMGILEHEYRELAPGWWAGS